MHASTSPYYPLFASLDVNAKIHEGKAGEMLWDRCIALGIETRKKLREFVSSTTRRPGGTPQEKWFFDPFVPDVVTIRDSKFTADVTDPRGRTSRRTCSSASSNAGHSIPRPSGTATPAIADGYAMVDPNKLTLLTPGIDRSTGEYLDFGVPATVVANYLREQRVVPEKCDLNSILFLMTPAEDESKLNTLDRQAGQVQEPVGSRRAARRRCCRPSAPRIRERYADYTLRRICNEMHDFYRKATSRSCSGFASARRASRSSRCRPKDAYEALVANEVDYVPLDDASRAASPRRSL